MESDPPLGEEEGSDLGTKDLGGTSNRLVYTRVRKDIDQLVLGHNHILAIAVFRVIIV